MTRHERLLPDYLARWNLHHPDLLTRTRTSTLYRVRVNDQDAVLKLLSTVGRRDERRGAVALTCFAGSGAAHLLAADQHAYLIEYLDGDTLVPLVQAGQDDAATGIIAQTLAKLHRAPLQKRGLRSLERWFHSLFRRALMVTGEADADLMCAAALVARRLLDKPLNAVVLHGDIHHENIRHHARRGWLAYDPKGLWGESTFDACNTLLNPCDMPALVTDPTRIRRTIGILADGLRVPAERLRAYAFAYACLSAAWSLEDGDDPAEALVVARMLR